MKATSPAITTDVLVIGGGINGAGVARDAALRGFSVVLVEQDDFAEGSSSRTSKLVHGGLRYLQTGDLRLVWEACHERRTLLRLAPHLVRPLSFIMPVFANAPVGRLRLRIGMWLYDLLAAFRNVHRHRMLSVKSLRATFGELRSQQLRGAAQYWDAAMDDARLTLENILSAREAGAEVHNQVRVQRLRIEDGRVQGALVVDRQTGVERVIEARITIACVGAWTGMLLGDLTGGESPVGTTRGTHIVVRQFTDQAWTLTAVADGRVFFVLPWLGHNLIGTTDIHDDNAPEQVAPTVEELDYLLQETNHFFPQAHLSQADILSAFAGLRPLAQSTAKTSDRSREHTILEPVADLLSMVGGKYTTYRAVAEELVDRIEQRLGKRQPCRTAVLPLPGGDIRWSAEEQWQRQGAFAAAVEQLHKQHGITAVVAEHWLATYGVRTDGLVQLVATEPALLTALCADHPHTEAEVIYAIRDEMAQHLDDWYLRRSRIGLQACHGFDSLARVAELFARENGWTVQQQEAETERTRAILDTIALSGPRAAKRSA